MELYLIKVSSACLYLVKTGSEPELQTLLQRLNQLEALNIPSLTVLLPSSRRSTNHGAKHKQTTWLPGRK